MMVRLLAPARLALPAQLPVRGVAPSTVRGMTPSMSLLTPPVCHTIGEIATTAVCSGTCALIAQLVLLTAFRRSSSRWLRESAGYTAHHIIALAFMVIATVVGFAGWFSPAAATASAASRMLVADGTARWLGAVLFGELLLWDFPCSIFIKLLREPVMLAHHVGLLATAALALRLPLFWGTFYLGWAELSNVPLQIWDTAKHAYAVAVEHSAAASTERRLAQVRDTSYSVFCALFFLVRVVGFTAITACGLFPDAQAVLPTAAAARLPIQLFLGLGTAFNCLMLYWFAGAVWGAVKPAASPTGSESVPRWQSDRPV